MRKIKFVLALLIAVMLLQNHYVLATNYYVDPVKGSMADDGSKEDPWKTLEEVFAADKVFDSGDTIFLLSGHHGSATIKGVNDGYVTIIPMEGHNPTLKRVTFSSAKKWKFTGVTVSPETAPAYNRSTLIVINGSASEIIVDSCFAYSVLDNTPWNAADWVSNACSGVNISGDNNILSNCHLLNVDHGILVESEGTENLITHNVIENFCGDGMRGIGNYNTFEYNTVMNCYDVDDNHDDGFQSYSRGAGGAVGKGTVYGIVLRGNTIINYIDPDQPFRGTLQGIGCFDGMFEEWLIENNVVITSHWHGITLLGATDCMIINNTVVDRNDQTPGPPWIQIGTHKDGTLGTGNVIRNNLTTSLSNTSGIGTVDFNIIVSEYDDYFVDYENFDLRLKEGCPAIDAGTDEDAPLIDIDGNVRPQGAGFDVGAYEYPSGPDTVPPLITEIISIMPGTVEIYFNERMDQASLADISHYVIDNGVEVTGATPSANRKSVILKVSALAEDIEYTLLVNNVTDVGGNPVKEDAIPVFEHVCGYAIASDAQEPNIPENTLDGSLDTRWSADGIQWIMYDMCTVHTISSLEMAFYFGNTRTSQFSVEVSVDNENWLEIFDGSSSGETAELETIDIEESLGRYLRINGKGNSNNGWNSYTEVVIGAEELIVYKSELTDSVNVANDLYDSDISGADVLLEAIDSAQAIIDLADAGQEMISYAFASLVIAMSAFRENLISGTDELKVNEIKVFPNPFNEKLIIEFPAESFINEINLVNMSGQVINFSNTGSNPLVLNAGNLPAGVYTLRIRTDIDTICKRIIKVCNYEKY